MDERAFEDPIATVDVALFTLRDGALCVVLARRAKEPFAGCWALPGGYIHTDEDLDTEATARRVLLAKAGLEVPWLEQLYTFSGPGRDDRGWSLSVAYFALVPEERLAAAGADLLVLPVDTLPHLPFDHNRIVATGVKRLRGKATYSSLPAFLLPEEFTFAELREVYERVLGVPLDPVSFRRKITEQDLVAPTGGVRTGAHRPAQLYRLSAEALKEFDRTI